MKVVVGALVAAGVVAWLWALVHVNHRHKMPSPPKRP